MKIKFEAVDKQEQTLGYSTTVNSRHIFSRKEERKGCPTHRSQQVGSREKTVAQAKSAIREYKLRVQSLSATVTCKKHSIAPSRIHKKSLKVRVCLCVGWCVCVCVCDETNNFARLLLAGAWRRLMYFGLEKGRRDQ